MIFFSSNLKHLRKTLGKKQEDIASFLNVKSNTISNYEKGISTPDFILLEKLVEYFKINTHDLLFEDLTIDKSSLLKSNTFSEISPVLEMIRDLSGENALLKQENNELKGALKKCAEAAGDTNLAAAG